MLLVFNGSATINKTDFFSVFESNSLDEIEVQILVLEKEKSSNEKNAFLGALLMKKARFMKTPKDKIDVFKKGKVLLEDAIKKDPENTTYRFLRLAIQENCPKILKYNSQIQADAKIVKLNLSKLDATTKKYIHRYAENSSALIL